MSERKPTVQSYMSGPLLTVKPECSLDEADRLLAENEVSGVVVVDASDSPVGVMSRTDLLRVGKREGRRGPARRPLTLPANLTVADVMHPDPVCIEHKARTSEAAMLMKKRDVHRVMVVDGTDAVGLLSVSDLLEVVAEGGVDTPIAEYASDTIAHIDVTHTVAGAIDRLRAASVHALVVMEDGLPAGVFSQVEALTARLTNADDSVEAWMNPAVLSMPLSTPANRAAERARSLRAPLIVGWEGGKPKAVVSASDLVMAAF